MHQSLTWSSKKTLRRCFKSWGRRIFTSCSSACFRQILRSLPAMPDMSPSSNGCYVICAFVVTVPWAAVAWAVVCPPLSLTSDYLMAISNVIAFSIVITMAAILNASGVTDIQASGQADEALRALAGPFTFIIFAAGIIGTGLLTVPVLAGVSSLRLGRKSPIGSGTWSSASSTRSSTFGGSQPDTTKTPETMVIPPFLAGFEHRIQAANFSFWAGVIPPMAILGRSLL